MLGFVKMAAVSAVLSFGVVTAYGPVPAAGEAPAKLFQDRVLPAGETASFESAALTTGSVPMERVSPAGKGDRLDEVSDCAAHTWPYIPAACARRPDGAAAPKRVRMITIETRVGENTSVLARVPQTSLAQR